MEKLSIDNSLDKVSDEISIQFGGKNALFISTEDEVIVKLVCNSIGEEHKDAAISVVGQIKKILKDSPMYLIGRPKRMYEVYNPHSINDYTTDFFKEVLAVSYDGGTKTVYVKNNHAEGNIYIPATESKSSTPIQDAYIARRSQDTVNVDGDKVGNGVAAREFDSINSELLERVIDHSSNNMLYKGNKFYKLTEADEEKDEEAKMIITKKVSVDSYTNEIEDILSDSRLILEQPVVSFTNSSEEPAMSYFPIDSDNKYDESNFPTIDGWATHYIRDGYRDAFEKYIASIFCSESNGRQAMFLIDQDGGTMKTTINNALIHLCGSMATGVTPSNLSGTFGLTQLVGKRLAVIGDLKNDKFVKSERFHNLTGNDYVSVEYKGGAIITMKMGVKFIIGTNDLPSININNFHEVSRVLPIYLDVPSGGEYLKTVCKLDSGGNPVKNNQGQLVFKLSGDKLQHAINQEMGYFVQYCLGKHWEYVTNNSSIELSHIMATDVDDMQSCESDEFINEVVSCIVPADGKAIVPSTIGSIASSVSRRLGTSTYLKKDIDKALKNKYNIYSKSYKTDRSAEELKKHNPPVAKLICNYAIDYSMLSKIIRMYGAKDSAFGDNVTVDSIVFSAEMECINAPGDAKVIAAATEFSDYIK